jgi:tetratricopeptide (TPR) repeat protein
MKKDALVFALSGMFFGLIAGWIIGSQHAVPAPARMAAVAAAQQPRAAATTPMSGSGRAAALDEDRVRALTERASRQPGDAAVRTELANLLFDAERYPDAITWYEQALALDPKNANISTDLGVSYYYTNQTDRAIAQFEQSLAVDPGHVKTLLNLGVVRAFGRQDLEGAARAWEQVVALAPDSPEGRAARQALDSMRSAHPGIGGGSRAPGTTGGG